MSDLQARLVEALAGQYTIHREIGSGGLASVFLAEERKHRRRVAMKVLRPDMTASLAATRFHREIAIAASLQHPHILPLFDSGEAGELLYFTMPYVEGETLRRLIEQQGVLPVADAVRIARQVASGLAYSHAQGIVHRDIKPENILVVGDLVQIADYGIARAMQEAANEQITSSGLAVGTPAYMSPEQALGATAVDGRADLYSLGCVLYEMLAGAPPFTGSSYRAVVARHVMDAVPPLRHARPAVSERLQQVVEKALAKDSCDRHTNLAEFAAELAELESEMRARSETTVAPAWGGSRIAVRRPAAGRRGVLVLPFLHLSPVASDDYIGAGLTDEIINTLSGVDALRVISHTSAAQLRGTSKRVHELGQELGVSFVLEGSVRRAGDRIRVATRLVSAESEEFVWGQTYEGVLGNLFELEGMISRAVVDALAVQISAAERRRLDERRASSTQAVEYYLRAKQEVYAFTGPALDRALVLLRKGAEISGDSTVFWAAMGYVYWQYVNAGISADPAYLQRARECADRMLAIDAESPEARRLLGLIEIHAKGDPQVAVDHLKAALDANPNDPDALFWLALIYGLVGRPSSGYTLAIRLLDIDPLTPLHHVVPGFLDVLDGDPQRALPWLARAHELEAANPIIGLAYGQALAMAGDRERACAVLQEIETHAPDSFFARLGRTLCHALRGEAHEARAAMVGDVADNARHDLQYSWTVAQCWALLGDHGQAAEWAGYAVRQGFWNYPLLAERDPLLAPARGDPRYMALMVETRAKWLHFRA